MSRIEDTNQREQEVFDIYMIYIYPEQGKINQINSYC